MASTPATCVWLMVSAGRGRCDEHAEARKRASAHEPCAHQPKSSEHAESPRTSPAHARAQRGDRQPSPHPTPPAARARRGAQHAPPCPHPKCGTGRARAASERRSAVVSLQAEQRRLSGVVKRTRSASVRTVRPVAAERGCCCCARSQREQRSGAAAGVSACDWRTQPRSSTREQHSSRNKQAEGRTGYCKLVRRSTHTMLINKSARTPRHATMST
jgi:ribosomal protein L36